jgi:hypothetical protein
MTALYLVYEKEDLSTVANTKASEPHETADPIVGSKAQGNQN